MSASTPEKHFSPWPLPIRILAAIIAWSLTPLLAAYTFILFIGVHKNLVSAFSTVWMTGLVSCLGSLVGGIAFLLGRRWGFLMMLLPILIFALFVLLRLVGSMYWREGFTAG